MHAPTTVTRLTEAADMTGSTGDSEVYLRFKLAAVPAAVSSSVNHPENGGEGNSAGYFMDNLRAAKYCCCCCQGVKQD